MVLTPPLILETLFLFPYEVIQNDLNPLVEHNWDKQLQYFYQTSNNKINK